ncbi:MAG: vitamin K epoxide reductase family protein [Gemmatimonadota bacterium]|nr:MAG: vitamin K epoxide reductase family protein [Gemmatimonadota bacterium]
MRKRMTIALLALTGLFISVYLLLYTLGFYGELVCGSGSCETVQTSEYASLFGIPVAGWGAAWYGAVLVLSFLAVQPAFAEAKWTTPSILLLAGLGLLFSIYLTYVELFVIYAICWWCVTSAVLTLLIFLLALPLGGRRRADAGGP